MATVTQDFLCTFETWRPFEDTYAFDLSVPDIWQPSLSTFDQPFVSGARPGAMRWSAWDAGSPPTMVMGGEPSASGVRGEYQVTRIPRVPANCTIISCAIEWSVVLTQQFQAENTQSSGGGNYTVAPSDVMICLSSLQMYTGSSGSIHDWRLQPSTPAAIPAAALAAYDGFSDYAGPSGYSRTKRTALSGAGTFAGTGGSIHGWPLDAFKMGWTGHGISGVIPYLSVVPTVNVLAPTRTWTGPGSLSRRERQWASGGFRFTLVYDQP